jgi:hypothetical protein
MSSYKIEETNNINGQFILMVAAFGVLNASSLIFERLAKILCKKPDLSW